MVTINDIAKLAGVSRTTVSRVLNSSGYVSAEAKKKVQEVIEKTGYIPSEHAKSLRTKKTKVIGVILPKLSTETSSRVVDGIDSELSKYGYHILLGNSNLDSTKEIEQLRLLQSRRVDGIILLATNRDDKLIQTIQELTIPVIALGQDIPGVSSVIYNDYNAAREVASLFLTHGHSSIGFIGVSEKDHAVGYERKRAYLDVMREAGIEIEPEWLQQGVFDITSGGQAVKRMLKNSKTMPTGIFAVTDRLAIGAMKELEKEGIKVPEDIAIMGIGASVLSKYVSPPLSTVYYNNEEAGIEAAKMMIDSLKTENGSAQKVIIKYKLVIRDSLS